MATRLFTRSLITTTKQSLVSFHRLRPLAASNIPQALSSSGTSGGVRGFSTRRTSSSLKDPNPNWSNRPPKETILLDGCDFEHWLVVMEKPEGDRTRDDIIDTYIKTLATVVGSEEEARMKIYSVSTRHYYAFGALVSEELSYKLKELDNVRWVLPDSYLHVREKDYGGEPFINGQAVPYDTKYHEVWVRNNENADIRNKRKDRPNRRRDMPINRGPSNTGGTPGGAPYTPPQDNKSGPQSYMFGPPNANTASQNNMSGPPNMNSGMPQNNMSGPPNRSPPNMRGDGMQGNNMSQPPSNYNRGVVPPGNFPVGGPGYAPTFQHGNVPMNNGVPPYQGQQQMSNYASNPPHGGYPYQNQNLPGRDMPSN